MKGIKKAGRLIAAGLASASVASNVCSAQAPGYGYGAPASYGSQVALAPPAYQPAAGPQQLFTPGGQHAARGYAGYPRVAQAGELPPPAEAINNGAQRIEVASPAPSSPLIAGPSINYSAPAMSASPTTYYGEQHPAHSGGYYEGQSYQGPVVHGQPYTGGDYGACQPGAYGCDSGACGSGPSEGYCDYQSGAACNVAAARPRRQFFVGVYGLYLDRVDDRSKQAVAYMTDTAGFTPGNDYYPMPADDWLFSDAADTDGLGGIELRIGSTFGRDSCGFGQPFAWELGYWVLDGDRDSSTLALPGVVSAANTQRIYSLWNYNGLNADLDGPTGTTWTDRPIYTDPGDPADGDIYANDVRIIAVRVRQHFQMENLELNFWRFGTPTAAQRLGLGVGGGACGGGSCGGGYGGACGVDSCGPGACGPASCGPAACAPCKPPRRYFLNGLCGVRYMRIDDSFGLDWMQAPIDTTTGSPTLGDPPVGWPNTYPGGFPSGDNSILYSDYEAENELVGLQLGCSMNWLVGCRWNVFADSNFGIYGNNVSVRKRVFGGGASEVTYANTGGLAVAEGSDTVVSYVGEIRTGVGYQVSPRCRLTAAYRFIGIGGLALGVEEFQSTTWLDPSVANHIDANNSIILHGVQAGAEWKF